MDKKDQSSMLAALNIMKRNKKKYVEKGYAEGGFIDGLKKVKQNIQDFHEAADPNKKESSEKVNRDLDPRKAKANVDYINNLAEGGEVLSEEEESSMQRDESIAAAIMAKRESEDAILKENYDEDVDDSALLLDSSESSDNLSLDEADMISQIRSKMRRQRQSKG